ncbi:S1 family peptidase [Streptomyces sp. NPDC002144]
MSMDLSRIAEVLGEAGSYGSGYHMDAGLVLTACHVVASEARNPVPASARVRFADTADWTEARVAWSDRDLDAALLHIPGSRSPMQPTRFGELTGPDPQYPAGCAVVGFPQVQASDSGRDTMGVAGTVDASTLRFSGRYQIDLTSLEHRENWSGMSGAAVFCGPLLTAIVRGVPDGFHARRLNAVPVALVLRDDGFRRSLRDTGHEVRELESVEMHALLDAPPVPGPPTFMSRYDAGPSISYLLHPRTRTVPFLGRGFELNILERWATSDNPVDVMMVTGRMGAGKTRLAVELGHRLGSDWIVGFLRKEPPDASPAPDLHPLTTSARPVLLVIDYAETRPAWIRLVLDTLAGYERRVRIRLLLLSRTAESWHEVVKRCHNKGLLSSTRNHLALRDLNLDEDTPVLRMREAAHAFARGLYGATGTAEEIAAIIDHEDFAVVPPDPFSLGIVACAAAISASSRVNPGLPVLDSPYEVVLDREETYWERGARVFGLATDQPHTRDLLRTLVVTQALCGARDVPEAVAAVGAAQRAFHREDGVVQPSAPDVRLQRSLLKSLYPSHDEEWGRFGPHALTALLIERAEHEDPGLTEAILRDRGLHREQRRRSLETILLGSSQRPWLADLALAALAGSPGDLGVAVAEAADAAEQPAVWLAEARTAVRVNAEHLSPEDRGAWLEVADYLDEQIAARLRPPEPPDRNGLDPEENGEGPGSGGPPLPAPPVGGSRDASRTRSTRRASVPDPPPERPGVSRGEDRSNAPPPGSPNHRSRAGHKRPPQTPGPI